MSELSDQVQKLGENARAASRQLSGVDAAQRNAALLEMARAIRARQGDLLAANQKDLDAAKSAGLADSLVARLKLDAGKIDAMASGIESIARQIDPVGQTIEGYVRPDGLRIEKRRVPIGVVLFFYESRPNVTSDAAALCLKSGNAVILRGGKEAFFSNQMIGAIIRGALAAARLPEHAVQIVESTDRALVPLILKLDRYIDLVIPRGGESLIRAVVAESTIPVLKHFTGNCHIYVDRSIAGIEDKIVDVIVNAKTSYAGAAVCNAVEHVLVHQDVAREMIPVICRALAAKNVEIRADDRARSYYPTAKPATTDDWWAEYLAFIIGIKVVDSIDEAMTHINHFGSHHTDAILTQSVQAIDAFTKQVDSASVMVNCSTRLADGGEYQLGAEIGISTDKLHARGPMGASDLCTYKWIVTGDGHLRR